jgi:magnesium-transporting ATPase (P-type)
MVLMDDNFASIVKAVERGRAIYSGIQKFVAFIMSVHIAEVIQIFVCVVAQMPLMRTPLQILFLILVTDLPPSVALGMEPGERDILKSPPRPKSEPIVLWWMWVGIMANGLILSAVILGVYIFCLEKYVGTTQFKEFTQRPEGFTDEFCTDGRADFDLFLNTTNPSLTELLDPRQDAKNYCLEQYGLIQARTVAFISLVFSENIRAYISRSFDQPVWVNFFGNQWMQIAVALAIVFMLMAVLIPVLSDKILLLDGLSIGGEGWAIALVGPVATVILCELFKIPTAMMKRNYERQVREGAGDESDDSDDYTTSGSDDL